MSPRRDVGEAGKAYTIVTKEGGEAFTLATGAGGAVTSFGGSVFTIATADAGKIVEKVTSTRCSLPSFARPSAL